MTRGLVLALTFSLVSIGIAPAAWAACSGSSPNLTAPTWADVSACYQIANNGDTITVSAGTFTATSGTSLASGKAVTLQGSGVVPQQGAATSGGTVINVSTTSYAVLGITESTAGNIRVRNLTFKAKAGSPVPNYGLVLINNRVSNGKVVVLDHLTFDFADKLTFGSGEGASAIMHAASRGVVSNSIFTGRPPGPGSYTTNRAALRCAQNISIAPATWSTAPTYGSSDTGGVNNLYFETNRVEFYNDAIDLSDGCRLVVRHSTFTNSILKGHGADSGYGARHFEYYNNHFVCAPGVLGSIGHWIFQRGGTGVVTENVFDRIDRATCGYVPGGGPAMAAQIYKLTQSYVGCWPSPYSYPVVRQIGWGWSGGGTTTQNGFRQDLEPTYFWNNTNNTTGSIVPMDAGSDTCGNGLRTADYYKQDRDWYLSAKPGYVEYQYPHPLGSTTSPSPSPSPSAPSAPSSLQVR
jgi:hypothetical protein